MNKSALKKFATTMRRELISTVQTKVDFLLSDAYKENLALYDTNKKYIAQIAERYSKDGDDFIEEVAYTWFNRLVALRFMDVNDITLAQTISTTEEQPIPQIFVDAKAGNIDENLNLNRELFFDLIDNKIAGIKDPDNEAYKMLFISVCNYYGKLMPTMFEEISDYTELLLPEDMLSPNSLRAEVVEAMSEEDCQDIEVIGWLYQFYISEKKDDVFAMLKKNKKITPANIPAATQLFTPHWIVKYMVENSLGKLWMLNHPNSSLKEQMKYYIENEEETSTFIKVSSPEEITFLDPCCGSGHTLTYAFDLLTAIYEEEGYNKSDIPSLILENNLFGCDIDKRASVLANFALTMKARQYYKRFFRKEVKPNIVELQDYGSEEFAGIKNFGSLLTPQSDASFSDGVFGQSSREYELQKRILSDEFHCVVTNPPYMGSKGMNKELGDFVKKNYPDSKSDLMTVFMKRGIQYTKSKGLFSFVTLDSWMFLSTFEKLRIQILEKVSIDSLVHIGWNTFPDGHTYNRGVAFTLINNSEKNNAVYIDLSNTPAVTDKQELFLKRIKTKESVHIVNKNDFSKIPGRPIAYWLNDKIYSIFSNNKKFEDDFDVKQGFQTGNNDYFIRYWYEISKILIKLDASSQKDVVVDKKKWVPYNKGGDYRRWYGNNEYLVAFDEKNYAKLGNSGNCLPSRQFYFREGITWSDVTSGSFSGRYTSSGFTFSSTGSCVFAPSKEIPYILSMMNSKVGVYFLKILAPAIHFTVGAIKDLPYKNNNQDAVSTLAQQNIDISKEEWDSRETSWDFTKNELIKHKSDSKIETAFQNYCGYWAEKFVTLHKNEEELNRLFIDIYELGNELDEYVDFEDITILKKEAKIQSILIPPNTIEDSEEGSKTPEGYMYYRGAQLDFQADEIMKQFISFGVGVMFGRYSLDSDGLLIANMGQEVPTDTTFEIDDDNVIPVLEEDYFKDDIASRFVQFVKTAFGEEHLSENIKFIEDSLGTTLRKYFVKGFYEDHIKRYKKRPIYWMVASPKKGFMSLIYMHRYEPDTFARVRNSYLTEYIAKLEAHKETLHLTITSETASNKDKKDADKQSKNIEAKLKEVIAFDREKMMSVSQNPVEIDLDDGVKVNYCKFKEILYPIAGLCK